MKQYKFSELKKGELYCTLNGEYIQFIEMRNKYLATFAVCDGDVNGLYPTAETYELTERELKFEY